jgi:hypothetical protein
MAVVFPLEKGVFRDLLLFCRLFHRTEEAAGSNPARSTVLSCMEYLHHTGNKENCDLLHRQDKLIISGTYL